MWVSFYFFLDYHCIWGSYSPDNTPEGLNDISVGDGQDIGGWGWPRGNASGVFSMFHPVQHPHTHCCSTARGSRLAKS